MVAPDDDRRRDLPRPDELVEHEPRLRALAVAEPADPARQPLELDAFLRHADPAVECLVFREELENRLVRRLDVGRVA